MAGAVCNSNSYNSNFIQINFQFSQLSPEAAEVVKEKLRFKMNINTPASVSEFLTG